VIRPAIPTKKRKESNVKNVTKKRIKKKPPPHLPFVQSPVHVIRPAIPTKKKKRK